MQTFYVRGMSCGHCVRAITQAIQALDPAASVEADLASGKVQVDSRILSAQQIAEAVVSEGYEVADS